MNIQVVILGLVEKAEGLFDSEAEKKEWVETIIPSMEERKLQKLKKILENYIKREIEIDRLASGEDIPALKKAVEAMKEKHFEDQKKLQVKIHQQEVISHQQEEKEIDALEEDLKFVL